MKRLKVLVFDDSEIHRKSATLLFDKDYDLTVVGTYDEAQKALLSVTDYDKAQQLLPNLLEKAGLSRCFNPWQADKDASEADKKKHRQLNVESYALATTYPDFDIVLTDLLVPASRQAQGGVGEKFVGQEMPLGTTIALLALCAGVKKVAVVTDMNHHHHPASAAFDCFRICKAEGIEIICTNHVGSIAIDEATCEVIDRKFLESEEGKEKYPYPEGESWGDRKGMIHGGKDWKQVLLKLTGELDEQ